MENYGLIVLLFLIAIIIYDILILRQMRGLRESIGCVCLPTIYCSIWGAIKFVADVPNRSTFPVQIRSPTEFQERGRL